MGNDKIVDRKFLIKKGFNEIDIVNPFDIKDSLISKDFVINILKNGQIQVLKFIDNKSLELKEIFKGELKSKQFKELLNNGKQSSK